MLVPVLVFSQNNESNKSLTPYANIEFEDGFVIYSVGWNTVLLYPRLIPTVVNMKLMQLKYDHNNDNVSGEYINKSQKAIMDYVNTEPVDQLTKSEMIDYLKLCALLVIWDKDLSNHAVVELEKLVASRNDEIKGNAELLIRLLEFYKKYAESK